ncbi:MAG: response regulator [Proteobacteria bacterium]|nr:response regulator [Pseudomonadota bacterium]
MRAIIRQLLGRVGISNVSEAEHGEQALAMVRSPTADIPDVIICDLHMQTMDGMEFCNQLRRSEDARHRAIPILILTGDEDEMLHAVSRQVGAAKILMKPIAANDLLTEIRAVVGFDAGVAI